MPATAQDGAWDDDDFNDNNYPPGILVIASEQINFAGGFYAYDVGGVFHIFKDDGLFWKDDTFMGRYVPGTPDDHNLKLTTTDPVVGQNGLETTAGTTTYWKFAQ